MKIYVKAVVSIENLKTQFAPGMEDELFQKLIEIDPTANFEQNKGGKYCPWIFKQYKNGNLKEEDFVNVNDALIQFARQYRKYPKQDLGQYKTVEEFLEDSHKVGNRELTDKEKQKLLKKQAHNAGDEDKKFLVADGDWEVWQPLTYQGSISLARTGGEKATWCTAYEGDDGYWQRYTRQGPLYIFINTKDPHAKMQLHFPTNSWYNINDHQQGMDAFYKFASEHPAIEKLFEIKTEDGIQYRAGEVVGFDPKAKDLIFNEEITSISYKFPDSLERVAFLNPNCIIKSDMFKGLTNLYKVKLPTALKEIPSRCFEGCTSLESIKIPDTVTTYSQYAFADCTSLKEIKHSSNLTKLEDDCFKNCKVLETPLPDSITYLGARVFAGCGLESFTCPSSMEKISKESFKGSDITEINLNNVTNIGPNAFTDSNTEYIDLSKVNHIGSNGFRECKMLTSINLNTEDAYIGPFAFYNCENIEDTITLYPTTNAYVGAFDGCKNATIVWEKEDEDYEFNDIGKLICSDNCKQLIDRNKDYILIETTSGKTYPVTK